MFGYITADMASLSEEQKNRYRSCYCGLCRRIGSEFGTVSRLTLNYDLTFLTILLSSLYEPEAKQERARCLAHPFTTHTFWQTEVTGYTAAMNIALSYHKCLDNWSDDRNISSYLFAAVLRKCIKQISSVYPRQWNAIRSSMEELSRLEASDCQSLDLCANAFAKMMGELFVWKKDRWMKPLRVMGEALGRYIYLTDALLDLPEDRKHGRYNPLSSRPYSETMLLDYQPILKILAGECCDAFERLPLIQDLDLLRNILYSGIWTRYRNQLTKEQTND